MKDHLKNKKTAFIERAEFAGGAFARYTMESIKTSGHASAIPMRVHAETAGTWGGKGDLLKSAHGAASSHDTIGRACKARPGVHGQKHVSTNLRAKQTRQGPVLGQGGAVEHMCGAIEDVLVGSQPQTMHQAMYMYKNCISGASCVVVDELLLNALHDHLNASSRFRQAIRRDVFVCRAKTQGLLVKNRHTARPASMTLLGGPRRHVHAFMTKNTFLPTCVQNKHATDVCWASAGRGSTRAVR